MWCGDCVCDSLQVLIQITPQKHHKRSQITWYKMAAWLWLRLQKRCLRFGAIYALSKWMSSNCNALICMRIVQERCATHMQGYSMNRGLFKEGFCLSIAWWWHWWVNIGCHYFLIERTTFCIATGAIILHIIHREGALSPGSHLCEFCVDSENSYS